MKKIDKVIGEIEELMEEYAPLVDHDIPVFDVLEKLLVRVKSIKEGSV